MADHAMKLAEALAQLLTETHDWAWSLCGEREGLDEIRDMGKAALRDFAASQVVTVDVDAAVVVLANEREPWRTKEKAELAAWYVATIGYDPFVDDPAQTITEIRAVKAEYERTKGEE